MTFNAITQIAVSRSLAGRITAAAAQEDAPGNNPELWTNQRIWELAAQPGWADAWLYAIEQATVNQNPDTGARDDVINDAMILAAVQSIIASEAAADAPPP